MQTSTSRAPGPPELLSSGWLKAWDADERFAADVLALIFPEGELNVPFECVIRGCSARIAIVTQPAAMNFYRYLHTDVTGHSRMLTLAEAFASFTAKRLTRLGKGRPAHALWKRRLLLETGHVPGPQVAVPDRLEGVPVEPAKALEGFVLLLRVRRLTDPAAVDSPYSGRFAADWCGLTHDDANRAIRWLVKHDLLLHVGEQKAKGSFERGTFEYRLGYRT